MSLEIFLTTAEHVIGATDAAIQNTDGVNKTLVADFLNVSAESALYALSMAQQIGLLRENKKGEFVASFPYAVYLVTSARQQKAAILRFMLEQYPPYKTFKFRLAISGLVHEAAAQTRALHNISAHRDVILHTLVDLGTYANSLISEGAGLYRPTEGSATDYLLLVADIIQERETAELHVRRRIGTEAAEWVDDQGVLGPLVTAYQRVASVENDPRAPIVHAGNAVESFLTQLADHHKVPIQNASGINAKVEVLVNKGHLSGKHKFMLKYLGHVRNAADHGTDPEIRHTWEISKNTAIEYVHVASTVISDIVAYLNQRFVV